MHLTAYLLTCAGRDGLAGPGTHFLLKNDVLKGAGSIFLIPHLAAL